MSNVTNDNADWGRTAESAACERWSARRVSDETDWHDIEFTDAATGDARGEIALKGDVGECKAARVVISDSKSTRAGRWWFRKLSHDRLADADGVYVLTVYDEIEGILRMAFCPANEMGRMLEDRWTPCGASHQADRSAQLPWTSILDRRAVIPNGER